MDMNFILSTTTNRAMEEGLKEALVCAEKDIENSVIIILPETKTVMAERYLLENSKRGAFTNIYICSYNRLLSKLDICSESNLLTREAGIYIVKRLVQELSTDLVCYKKASLFLGFAENIYDTIAQLKSSGITPEEFSSSARKSTGALASKMQDIALLYDAYENYLSNRYLDMSDSLTEIARVAQNSDFIKQSYIYVLGFTSVTHQMDDVIENFVKNAKSVTVSASFMHPNKKNFHIADNEVYNHFKKVADRLRIAYNPIFVEEKFTKDVGYIKDNLFVYPVNKTKLNGDLSLLSFSNIQDEIMNVANNISAAIRNGSRYRDFGVLLLDFKGYYSEVKRLFEEYNIPCFMAKKYDLSKHCLSLLISHILEIARIGYESEHLIALSKSPLIHIDGDSSEFENYILKTGVNFSGFLSSFNKSQDDDFQSTEAERVRACIINQISTFVERLKNVRCVKEYISILNDLIFKLDIEEKLNNFKQEQELLGELEMAAVTEQVLDKTQKSFDCLLEFLGETNANIQEFSSLLLSGLSSVEISLIPLELDSVVIQENTDGMRDIKKLFILGASEGKFPLVQEDCGIIRDEEINNLSEMFRVKIEPTIRTINRRERYKSFENIISYDKIQISYSSVGPSLEENTPSSMLISIAGLFEDYTRGGDIIIPLISDQQKLYFTKTGLERYLCTIAGKVKANMLNESKIELSSIYEILKDNSTLDFHKVFENGKKDTNLSVTNIYFKNNKTSISQLEKYFTCPFMHFADYGLGLKDRQLSKMKAVDVGDVLHAVAENFVNKLMHGEISDDLHESDEIISKVLSNNENFINNNRMLISVLTGESKRLMHAIYNQLKKSEFKPVSTESWFGDGSKYGAIKLANNVSIVGKIDRIDKCGDYYRVIDYKTGKIEESPETLYYGKKVQLLSYIQAIENDIKAKPAGALYFPIRNEWADSKKKAIEQYKNKGYLLKDENIIMKMDSDLYSSNTSASIPVRFIKSKTASKDSNEREFGAEGNLLSDSQFKNITKYIYELEKQAVSEIMDGYIEPSPLVIGKKSPCVYCDYRFVCGLEKTKNSEGRKAIEKIEFVNFIEGE